MFLKRWINVLVLFLLAGTVFAQDSLPPATIVNDEGGAVVIQGEVAYTYAFFTAGVSEPLIILEDQTGFVNRDLRYIFPQESQVLGQITSDFFTSPFTYSLSLPIEPQAPLNDVDQDGETDTGVMIFQIAYWTNAFGNSFLEERDMGGGGWSGAYASADVSSDIDTLGEYIGGSILIYAPDDQQAFPSGFGEDSKLFTEDDPIVSIPQGYTIVNMDSEVFTFDRSRVATVDLIEGEGSEADDFSNLSYTEAFDALIDKFSREYAFTEYYGLDWEALSAQYRPLIEEAEANRDGDAFGLALWELIRSLHDGHIAMSFTAAMDQQFRTETDGGLGFAIRELSDGRVIVNFVLDGGPVAEAGIELGAEITAINGVPTLEAVDAARPWSSPFSTEHVEQLQQLRYAIRFPLNTEVSLSYINPGASEETVTLTTIGERQSFAFSSFAVSTSGYELPVEYYPIADYLYVDITSFFDDERLTVILWERMLQAAKDNGANAIILDMRNNGGGSGFLADQLAAYFFQDVLETGNTGRYDDVRGEFVFDENLVDRFILPPEELRYDGPVVVLVGPNCASACEFFSYNMSLQDRATIIGHYPSAGLGGSVEQFFMPDGISVQLTVGRAVDADGNIHIEGQGVVPDVVVPLTSESAISGDDAVLEASLDYLGGVTALDIVDGGIVEYDTETTGTISPNQRVRYTFTIIGGADPVGVYLMGDLDTYLRIYEETGTDVLTENDDFAGTLNSGIGDIALDEDLTVVIEIGTYNDSESGEYTLILTTGTPPFEISTSSAGTIAVGDTVEGDLTSGNRVQYTLSLTAGEAVNVYLTGDLDTYLRIYDADGVEILAENDDFDGLTSGIEGFSIEADGDVIIEAASFGDGGDGAFTLVIEASE